MSCLHILTGVLFVIQIVKILNLYTPLNEFEERVTVSFIRNIQVTILNLFNQLFSVNFYIFSFIYIFEPNVVYLVVLRIVCRIGTMSQSSWWTPSTPSLSCSPIPPQPSAWRPFTSLPTSASTSSLESEASARPTTGLVLSKEKQSPTALPLTWETFSCSAKQQRVTSLQDSMEGKEPSS